MGEAKKKNILITGCSGFIGFRCSEKLLQDFQILGIDVTLTGHLPGIELIGVDLASPRNIREHMELIEQKFGNELYSVIHLASYYNFGGGHWKDYERITINGTKELLKILKERFLVGQFIFSSSMLVHAPCEVGEKITEKSPLKPKWNYPKSKVITEKLIQELHGDIPYVILRIAGVYDDLCHSIPLAHQVKRIYEDTYEGHVFAGDISHGASFIHLEDLADAICRVIQKRDQLPRELILLIGEEETLSYDSLQRQISKLIWGQEWKTKQIPKVLAKIGAFFKKGFIKPWMIAIADDHYSLDISRAKELLDWEPKQSLKKTIPKWIEMLKNEPIAWYDMNKLKISNKIRYESE